MIPSALMLAHFHLLWELGRKDYLCTVKHLHESVEDKTEKSPIISDQVRITLMGPMGALAIFALAFEKIETDAG